MTLKQQGGGTSLNDRLLRYLSFNVVSASWCKMMNIAPMLLHRVIVGDLTQLLYAVEFSGMDR